MARHRKDSTSGWFLPLVVVVITASCGQRRESRGAPGTLGQVVPSSAKEKVLAEVGDKVITVGDFAQELEMMEQSVAQRYVSVDRKKQLLDQMVVRELLAQQALKEHLNHDPRVVQRVKRALARRMIEQLRSELVNLDSISDEDVNAYYQSHRSELTDTEGNVQPLEQVRQRIRNDLLTMRRDQALRDFVADLRKQAKIEVFEQNPPQVRAPDEKSAAGAGAETSKE